MPLPLSPIFSRSLFPVPLYPFPLVFHLVTVVTFIPYRIEAFGYQDASYGYDGYYVDLSEYQYYFRQGFNRGYEDGYYSRSQYGRYSNGTLGILGTILEQILNLQLVN